VFRGRDLLSSAVLQIHGSSAFGTLRGLHGFPDGLATRQGCRYDLAMSIQELEAEVKRLSPSELAIFSQWFENFAVRCAQNKEHSAWINFSAEGLARAYSDSEPEYTLADIKRQWGPAMSS
jgi:hypothetical protein